MGLGKGGDGASTRLDVIAAKAVDAFLIAQVIQCYMVNDFTAELPVQMISQLLGG